MTIGVAGTALPADAGATYAGCMLPDAGCTLQHVVCGAQQVFIVEAQQAVCWQPDWQQPLVACWHPPLTPCWQPPFHPCWHPQLLIC